MTSATARVFNTAELLEQILLHGLSPAEVTRARQINSFFRAGIDSSLTLRRVMFLEPILECDHDTYGANLQWRNIMPVGVHSRHDPSCYHQPQHP